MVGRLDHEDHQDHERSHGPYGPVRAPDEDEPVPTFSGPGSTLLPRRLLLEAQQGRGLRLRLPHGVNQKRAAVREVRGRARIRNSGDLFAPWVSMSKIQGRRPKPIPPDRVPVMKLPDGTVALEREHMLPMALPIEEPPPEDEAPAEGWPEMLDTDAVAW
jgi:hypothetical protein